MSPDLKFRLTECAYDCAISFRGIIPQRDGGFVCGLPGFQNFLGTYFGFPVRQEAGTLASAVIPMDKAIEHIEKLEIDGLSKKNENLLIHGAAIKSVVDKGLKFVFTGDTAECDSLTEAARDSDLLICEATYGENEQRQLAIDHGHMNFSQAADTAKNAGVKRLWLTHYSPMIDDPMKYLHNAQNIFPDAICGHDGMNITLTFED